MVQMQTMGGARRPFPRVGAWTVVEGRPGVIYEIRTAAREGAEGAKGAEVVEAVVHLVDKKGETEREVVVEARSLEPAPYDAVRALDRAKDLTPFLAAQVGLVLSAKQRKELTPLEKLRLNLELSDEERAEAEIARSAEEMERLKAARLAVHPEAVALEEQIEKERLAFIRDVEKRRTALARKLTPQNSQR